MLTEHKFALSIFSLGIVLLLSASALAQMNGVHAGTVAPRGVPASVTSFGFGGHPGFHGVPASVTSQGFGAPLRIQSSPFVHDGFHNGAFNHEGRFRGEHHRRFYAPLYGSYYAPYAYPYYEDNYASDDTPSNEVQAQRDYDSRQQLNNDYRSELNSRREEPAQQQGAPQPVAAQPSTVLIFKDGHQDEVANYAIVGTMLYELNDGRSRKVQLADLDLTATVKENDDRGVEFQVPAQAN